MENVGKAAVAEFIGTFALIFFGAGAIVMTGGGDLVAIALAHGLAIAIMVSIMAHISGGVFNPAIQVALWVTGKMPTGRSGVYIVAQLLGAVAAAATLKYILPVPAFDADQRRHPRRRARTRARQGRRDRGALDLLPRLGGVRHRRR